MRSVLAASMLLLLAGATGMVVAGSQDAVVEIIDPVGGEAWSGIHIVRWADQFTAADRPVHWSLAYSLDLGATWNEIAGAQGDYRTTLTRAVHSWPFDTTQFADTTSAMFRITLTVTGSGTATNYVSITRDAVAFDNTDPSATATVTATDGASGWAVSFARVALAATDATSGVATIWQRVDGGAYAAYTEPLELGDGDHLVEYFAEDRARNAEPAKAVRVLVDTTDPISSHSLQGALGDESWWTTNVNVALFAADDTSGALRTFARADGGEFATITSGLLVTGDGDHVVDYYAEDVAGNLEFAKTIGFRIDATAPSTAFEIGAPKSTDQRGRQYLSSATDIVLLPSDATSGVRDTFFSFDGAGFQLYSEPVHLEGADGRHTLEYFTVDRAGNVEGTNRLELFLDNTAPTVQITRPLAGSVSAGGTYFEAGETIRFLTAPLGEVPMPQALPELPLPLPVIDVDREDVTPVAGAVTVEVATQDGDGSGVARVEYFVDGVLRYTATEAPFSWTWDTTVDTLGEHVLQAVSIDELGFASSDSLAVVVAPAGETGVVQTAHQGVSFPAWLKALIPALDGVAGLDALLAALPGVPGSS